MLKKNLLLIFSFSKDLLNSPRTSTSNYCGMNHKKTELTGDSVL